MIVVELRKMFRRPRTWATIAVLNALLVGAGVRVTSIHAEQRTLEEVVLDVTGPGSDRFGAGR